MTDRSVQVTELAFQSFLSCRFVRVCMYMCEYVCEPILMLFNFFFSSLPPSLPPSLPHLLINQRDQPLEKEGVH